MVRRGEVWWLHLPGDKPRPACVLTRDAGIPVLNRVIVAPATSRIRGIETEVELDEADGMPRACVLSFDNVRAVDKRLLSRRITELSPSRMSEVCHALAFATGCS